MGRLTEDELREMSAYYLGAVREAWKTVCSKLAAGEQPDAQTYFDLAREAVRRLESFSPEYPQEKREAFKRTAFQMTIVELLKSARPVHGKAASSEETQA
jgi:hypothetical protein